MQSSFKKLFPVYFSLVAAFVFAVFTLLWACQLDGYTKYQVSQKNISFSFDYSKSFGKPLLENLYGVNTLPLTVKIIRVDPRDHLFDASISIEVIDTASGLLSAKSVLESDVNSFESGFIYNDFELTKQSSILLSGQNASMIDYKYNSIVNTLGYPPSLPWIGYRIYLEDEGTIYLITMESDSSRTSQVEVELNHFLKTFKIVK